MKTPQSALCQLAPSTGQRRRRQRPLGQKGPALTALSAPYGAAARAGRARSALSCRVRCHTASQGQCRATGGGSPAICWPHLRPVAQLLVRAATRPLPPSCLLLLLLRLPPRLPSLAAGAPPHPTPACRLHAARGPLHCLAISMHPPCPSHLWALISLALVNGCLS